MAISARAKSALWWAIRFREFPMCLDHSPERPDAAPLGARFVAEPQAQIVDLAKMPRRDLLRALATGSLVVLAPAAVTGCATNAETGRSQMVFVGDGQMAQMALSAWAEQKQKTPISRDPALNARLNRVGQRIAQSSGRAGEPWEFVVFDTAEKNAFVLPGNKVGFYKGLMELAENDGQIATVLGHEVGHVTGRHAAERFSQSTAGQLGLAVGGAVIGANMADGQTRQLAMAAMGIGLQVGVLLPFSRLQESEADRLGVDYMHRAGYDVRQSLRFWERMNQSGGSRPPQILSTHPDPVNRMSELRAYINARGYAVV
jgi:predicted Zn-dependent protease